MLATQSANSWIVGQHLAVLKAPKLNPWSVKATVIATAPYFGHDVEGTAPDAVAKLRVAIGKAAEESAKHRKIADEAGLKLVAYEGGQHVYKKAQKINRDPVMNDLYKQYLDEMSKYFTHFSHYCHVGQAGDGGAGARSNTPASRSIKRTITGRWSIGPMPRRRNRRTRGRIGVFTSSA